MPEGVVKIKNLAKRFMVVEGEDGQEYFVSTRSVAGGQKIHVGDRVVFEEDPDASRGKRGKNVRLCEYA